MSEADYAGLITAAHHELQATVILIWDRLNTHVSAAMRVLVSARSGWLTEVRAARVRAWSAMKASLGNPPFAT